MSVDFKNWKELCKEKDERIKELEGKLDLIVERLEEICDAETNLKKESYEDGDWESFDMHSCRSDGIYWAIEIVKGVMNERD